jgi:hypothetical protein
MRGHLLRPGRMLVGSSWSAQDALLVAKLGGQPSEGGIAHREAVQRCNARPPRGPLAEVRYVPRIHAALAYMVQFLVKRRLLVFDRASSTTDCVVDGIVQFAQILGGHFV